MRIGQIITTDLATEKMILEERLENIMNSDVDIEIKVMKIKRTLKKIALVESAFVKWQNYITPIEGDEN